MVKGKLRTVETVSSGGVVFRSVTAAPGEPRYEIVLVGQSRSGRWGLPKGAPTAPETLQEAALREVAEETGLDACIEVPLGHIEYWFGARGIRYHKTVHFYLMRAVGGDLSRHDQEHDLVRWFGLPEAYEAMSYSNEKDVVRRAEERLVWHEQGPTGVTADP